MSLREARSIVATVAVADSLNFDGSSYTQEAIEDMARQLQQKAVINDAGEVVGAVEKTEVSGRDLRCFVRLGRGQRRVP